MTTMFRTSPFAIAVPPHPISTCISRLRLIRMRSRSVRSFSMLSAPKLTGSHWFRNSFSNRFCLYLLILSSPSAISWLPLSPILASTRDLLRGRRNQLLCLFSTLSFAFLICRLFPLAMFPGNLLKSRIPIIVLQILLTLPFVLSFPLLMLIVTLQQKYYLLNFHSTYPSLLAILPILLFLSSRPTGAHLWIQYLLNQWWI